MIKGRILLILGLLLVVGIIVTLYSCLIASKEAEKCVNKALENAKLSHGHGTQEQ